MPFTAAVSRMPSQETPPGGQIDELAEPALRTFFRIAEAWSLNDPEQMRVLGISSLALLRAWRGEGLSSFDEEALERISLVIGIFKAINTLLPDAARANAWMRSPNKAPLLQGETAVAFIVDGDLARLQALRAYLDAEVGHD
ncbi:antitoxin Xre/MbcA/ParS toxin-binding domain-containing protein [Sphingomonas sp. ID1715]|uniref:antitoxin Xre/MbcA/ParS toxin-binding domain-containing protein n=1 Tax=Sphingomonas sp. ID1715 TaxID=1656898 RepID=UPI00349FF83B